MKQAEASNQYSLFDPLRVDLPIYEGPFEALLDMIRKKKFSVYTVRLADICQPFLEYLKQAEQVNLEIGSDFISMASTLILIKSRTLLPKHEIDDEEEEEETEAWAHEEEIRAKLIELERYEKISGLLLERDHLYRDFFPRPEIPDFDIVSDVSLVPRELSLFALIQSYNGLSKKLAYRKRLRVEKEQDSLQNKILEILDYFLGNKNFEFISFLKSDEKIEIILLFLSILELSQKNVLRITQNEDFSNVYCYRTENFGEAYQTLMEQHRLQTNSLFSVQED